MATKFRQLSIKDIRKETGDCVSIAFDIPQEWEPEFRFKQGQNVTVRTWLNGEELRRSYSICSSPLDQELRIAVKKTEMGRFSTYANHSLKKGDILDIMAPTGRFYTELDASHQKEYIAFAAGSGITPIMSIIKTTLQTEPHSSFTLVYGNRNRASIIFREELEALKNQYMDRFRLYHVLSRETTDVPLQQGRIDVAKCDQLFPRVIDPVQADEYFLCGPESMIFCLKDYLLQKGVAANKIHFELFTTPGQSSDTTAVATGKGKKPATENSRITVQIDGLQFDFDLPYDGDSILDGALKQGADLPFACKGGVCATCRAKLVSGEVEMETNYALEPEETEQGFILTCQSHPRSGHIIVDFDAK